MKHIDNYAILFSKYWLTRGVPTTVVLRETKNSIEMLHRKGCECHLCDGSGRMPGGVVFAAWYRSC